MRTTLLALALLSAAAPLASSQSADVTVVLLFNAGNHLAPGVPCPVSVPAGADGAALLDAAVASGCILSWSAVEYSFGSFVTCINDVCSHDAGEYAAPAAGLEGTFWALSENLHLTSYGIDGVRADEGDVVGFTYEDYYGGLADYVVDSALP